ncbi:hypothetical protein N1851_024521 [Merluccius polli]|uniref:DUF4371 domain-containing protein n=1 Tax=Merluccius polli TaxID=89951 RepID=A0AA47NVW5_MERPO|nr:hypothetical protein N1851_024521 [Merluccius polli]
MIRFVSASLPEEHLIGLLDLDKLDAQYITSEILKCLSDAGYSADNILSQCDDGASVVSGVRGSVQALLQQKLGKYIPYIHCYNHQLHLVVVHAMQSEQCTKRFFDLSSSLYNFFQHHYITRTYDAPNLRRLMVEVTSCITENEDQIITVLSEVAKDARCCVCVSAGALLRARSRRRAALRRTSPEGALLCGAPHQVGTISSSAAHAKGTLVIWQGERQRRTAETKKKKHFTNSERMGKGLKSKGLPSRLQPPAVKPQSRDETHDQSLDSCVYAEPYAYFVCYA